MTLLSPIVQRGPPPSRETLWLPEASRADGIHVQATKGAGKSRLIGRRLAYSDFRQRKPLVIIDPTGGTIDNFLDKILRQGPAQANLDAQRIRYVETSGRFGFVTRLPLYEKRGEEDLLTRSQRVLDCFQLLDPDLRGASVQGWNALADAGEALGMVCAHYDLPITACRAILRGIDTWVEKVGAVPELGQAHEWLLEYKKAAPNDRRSMTMSLLAKVRLFHGQAIGTMFGPGRAGINWQQVLDERLCVLVDLRHDVRPRDGLRFKLLWLYRDLLTFLQVRGSGRHLPVSLIMDEVTYLLGGATPELVKEFDDFINVVSRNVQVQLTMAHQEAYQLSEMMMKSLLYGLKTQLLGGTADFDTAKLLAERFYKYNPTWAKQIDHAWSMDLDLDGWGNTYRRVDRSSYFSVSEQIALQARLFMELPRYAFVAAIAPHEGSLPTHVVPLDISGLDEGQYVNEAQVEKARAWLAERDGIPVAVPLVAPPVVTTKRKLPPRETAV